ncbi:MAG TPA: hypothetical protein VGK47_14775 [Nitrososphaeraceae archaeon]
MEYEKFIEIGKWPEGTTEAQKDHFRSYIKWKCEQQISLCVIYHPNCGCEVDQFVLLDRYPMSEKIISRCPACDKGILMEISDPIIFHLPLTKQDYTLEDIKNGYVTDSPQKHWIEMYKNQ